MATSEPLTIPYPRTTRPRLDVVRLARRYPLVLIGACLIVGLVLVGVMAPLLAPADPLRMSPANRLKPPGWTTTDLHFALGSDALGRDIFSRMLYGSRISLGIALLAVLVSSVIGSVLGLLAGYHGHAVDDLIMRVADVQLSFPVIMLAIGIIAVVGTSLPALVSVLALSGWVIYARTIRGVVLTLREMEFVTAARSLGAGSGRIIFLHILPNVREPILVLSTVQLASMILLESGLSFLGLGTQPPDASWGSMLAEGRDYLNNAWWVSTMPGVAIALAVLGFNLVGDGLRDLLDPRLRGR